MTTDPLFRMTVEDVFSIRDRGTVITGQIESGSLSVGDEIYLNHQGTAKKVVVNGIESFHKPLKQVQAGNNVGLLLRNIDKKDVQHGDVLTGSGLDFSWASQPGKDG